MLLLALEASMTVMSGFSAVLSEKQSVLCSDVWTADSALSALEFAAYQRGDLRVFSVLGA